MEIFHEYYNSDVQCLLELFSLNRPFTEREAEGIARSNHVHLPYGSFQPVLHRWEEAGLLQKTDDGRCVPGDRLRSFVAPLNRIEADCLASLCGSEAAGWFLPETLSRRLAAVGSETRVPFDPSCEPSGDHSFSSEEKTRFQTLLEAIRTRRMVEYTYRTAASSEIRRARMSPFRLEYSVFDGRWWLISYSREEDCTVKSRLENLRSVTILPEAAAPESAIRAAIERHLLPEPLVLRIAGEDAGKLRNALERCFLAFENMQEMDAVRWNESEYELRFRYFDWDRHLIVRKLMLLGEYVTVLSPRSVIEELTGELRAALSLAVRKSGEM